MLEDVTKIVGSIVRFIVGTVVWDFVLFQLGRGVVLAITLGRYPTRNDLERSRHGIQWAGVLTIVVVWLAIAIYNNIH